MAILVCGAGVPLDHGVAHAVVREEGSVMSLTIRKNSISLTIGRRHFYVTWGTFKLD